MKKFLSIWLVLLFFFPPPAPVFAQTSCGETYTVAPGDTLDSIADLCNTTVVAILEANPGITDPTDIFVGQVLRIPRPQAGPILAISPACGLPGTRVLVMASGFPSNTQVDISLRSGNLKTGIVASVLSNQFGQIETTITIPTSAVAFQSWEVVAEAPTSSPSFLTTSNTFEVTQSVVDPNAATVYVVQTGDTLPSIAAKFNRSLDEIYRVNPQLTNPVLVQPGQFINIPSQPPGLPELLITPNCGPVSTPIRGNGQGFPANARVNLLRGLYLTTYELVTYTNVSPNQSFSLTLELPPSALRGQQWVFIAETRDPQLTRAFSNLFVVTDVNNNNAPSIHIVQPGETLNEIAVFYQRSVESIQLANPQISNVNQLVFGENLIIPGLIETIVLTPASGSPGRTIDVTGFGFSRQARVDIGIGLQVNNYQIQNTVITGSEGGFRTGAVVPVSALPGQRWTVIAIQYTSGGSPYVAASGEFIVTQPKPTLEPQVSIWPLEGPPGTRLHIVGSSLPPLSQIQFTLGPQDAAPYLTAITWTEINGTFASEVIIPSSANFGEEWQVIVSGVDDPAIQSSSELFRIQQSIHPD